jgi:hypothetical protein
LVKPPGTGRDPDVPACPHVHFSEVERRRGYRAAFDVGADRPAAWPGWMPREPQAERKRGMTAVGSNRHTRAELSFERMSARLHAGDAVLLHQCAADGDRRLELRAGGDRILQEHPVKMAAQQGPARDALLVACLDRHPSLTRHAHTGDRHPHASIPDAIFRRRSSASVPGFTVSPHSLSRGNALRSTMHIAHFRARASTVAATEPAGPPPTTNTSIITSGHLVIWSAGHRWII